VPTTPAFTKVRVRCLGPGKNGEEHTFLSDDKINNRICGACREKLGRDGYARVYIANEGK
jgi:hypothetical protein